MTLIGQPAATSGGRAVERQRPRVGVVKFASCDGCQLTILDLEDHLLALTDRFDFTEFAEATSKRSSGPFDILFVEGSISTPEQAVEIVRLRAATRTLVTIGACATAGGIQALRNFADVREWIPLVYAAPDFISTLETSTPIADHVQVGRCHGNRLAPRRRREGGRQARDQSQNSIGIGGFGAAYQHVFKDPGTSPVHRPGQDWDDRRLLAGGPQWQSPCAATAAPRANCWRPRN